MDFSFPVGYLPFHKEQLYNFQLNRWYSLGYARRQDMEEAGSAGIKTFEDWRGVMKNLAEKAEEEGRLLNAAFYYRAAEFYTFQDLQEKNDLYNKFIRLFSDVTKDEPLERIEVPYLSSFLPAMRVSPKKKHSKGTIIMHGGFDSFIQEFYSWMKFFSARGYEVIAFEGPGQGEALRKNGLTLDYAWEKPAKALLDYLKLEEVSWLGISMGGWFCFRAAAFEPRIKRVIASSIAFDYMQGYNIIVRKLHTFFLNHLRNYTNRMAMKAMEKGEGIQTWMSAQLMHITGADTPMDAFAVWLELNEENLHSDLVRQDVLILTGKEDHFIPFKMHKKQVDALINARSITERVFTREDQAHNHCQIGNVGLALDVILEWLQGATE